MDQQDGHPCVLLQTCFFFYPLCGACAALVWSSTMMKTAYRSARGAPRFTFLVFFTVISLFILLGMTWEFVLSLSRLGDGVVGGANDAPIRWTQRPRRVYLPQHEDGFLFTQVSFDHSNHDASFLLEFYRDADQMNIRLSDWADGSDRFWTTLDTDPAAWGNVFANENDADAHALLQGYINESFGPSPNAPEAMGFLDRARAQFCILLIGTNERGVPVVVRLTDDRVAVVNGPNLIDPRLGNVGFTRRLFPVAEVVHFFTCGAQEAMSEQRARQVDEQMTPFLRFVRHPWKRALDASTTLPCMNDNLIAVVPVQQTPLFDRRSVVAAM